MFLILTSQQQNSVTNFTLPVTFRNIVKGLLQVCLKINLSTWLLGNLLYNDVAKPPRGNKGFFAMGNVNQEFTTGLPDGENSRQLNQ